MYSAMLKNELKHKDIYYLLIFVVCITFIFLLILNKWVSAGSEIYSYFEYFSVFYAILMITHYSNKYAHPSFRKVISLKDFNTIKLNVNLFIIIFFMLVIFAFLYFTLFYLFFNANILTNDYANFGFTSILVPFSQINLSFFFYCVFFDIFIIISFAFFFNSIFKGRTIQYAIITIYMLYIFYYNSTFWDVLIFDNVTQTFIFNPDQKINETIFNINLFLVPWTQVGIRGYEIFTNDTIYNFHQYYSTNYYDGIYQYIEYLPYITIFSYSVLALWLDELSLIKA